METPRALLGDPGLLRLCVLTLTLVLSGAPFVVPAAAQNAPGQAQRIVEPSDPVQPLPRVMVTRPTFLVLSLVQTIDTSLWGVPSPDPSGIAYDSVRDRLLVVDGEVDETGLWNNVNLFEIDRFGTRYHGADLTSYSIEPVGVAYDPVRRRVFISDDDRRRIFVIDAGPDTLVGTADDSRTEIRTLDFGSDDPEGITYDFIQDRLFVADGIGNRIYEIRPGPNGLYDGVDDLVTDFSTGSLGISDPESIEYNPVTGTLFLVERPPNRLIEATVDGDFIMEIDLSAVPMLKPAGIAFAPSTAHPDSMSLFIVDRGVDNNTDPDENDGRIFEIAISTPLPGAGLGGTVLARGADWRFHDLGQDLGSAWRAAGFDDSGWSSGPGVLGYGEGYVVTPVSYGPSSSDKYATTYFRSDFEIAGAAAVTGMTLDVMYDDGAIVYLNGTEVARLDVPSGPIAYDDYVGGNEGGSYSSVDLGGFIGLLVEGTNVLAAEVHQGSPSSSDMVFDAGLITAGSGLPAPDYTAPALAVLTAPADGDTVYATPGFDWQDVVDSSGVSYRIQIDDDSTFATPVADVADLATSAHQATVLAYGDYWWRIETLDGIGLTSGWSAAFSFTLSDDDGIPPTLPTLIAPADSALVTALPVFDWSDAFDVSQVHYTLQIDDDASFATPVIDAQGLPVSQHPQVLPAGAYWWRVQAFDAYGLQSGWSAAHHLVASYADTTAPEAPGLVSPVDAAALDGPPILAWSQVLDSSGVSYTLQVDDDPAFGSPLVDDAGVAATSRDLGMIAEGAYAWRVQATDSVGLTGPWSDVRSFSLDYPDTLPPAAATLIVPIDGAIIAQTPWFIWAPVVDESGVTYQLQIDDDAAFATPVIDSSGLAASSFHPAPLGEATYHWRVRATDGATLVGDWSAVRQVTIDLPDTLPPATPALLGPAAGATVFGTPSFDWSDVADESGVTYHLQVDQDSAFGSPVLDIAALATSDFNWELASGEYTWRVKAVDGVGLESDWSAARSLTIVHQLSSGGLLIERATAWSYHDLGQDLGTSWRDSAAVDSTWTSGPGPLGYGESYLNTVVSYGPDPDDVQPTTYFKRSFSVAGAVDVTALTLRVMYDDGFVAYLNGVEIERQRLPGGPISYSMFASSHEADNDYSDFDVSGFAAVLVEGANFLAFEVHQSGSGSSDLVFDVELESEGGGVAIEDVTPPAAPALLSPAASALIVGLPSFDWTDVSDPSGVSYRFQIDDDPGFATPEADTAGLAVSSFQPLVFAAGSWAWRVQAVDGAGNPGAWSAARSLTVEYPDTLPPGAPVLLAPVDQTVVASIPTLDWDDVFDPSGVRYRLQVDDHPVFATTLFDIPGLTTSSYTPASMPADGYYWRVKAIDSLGHAGPWSDAHFFTIQNGGPDGPGRDHEPKTTAAEPVLTPTFTVGPVPSRGAAVTVRFSIIGDEALAPVEIAVFDLSGRRLRTLARERFVQGMHHATWDGRDAGGTPAAPGIYFVRARRAAAIETRRVVLTR